MRLTRIETYLTQCQVPHARLTENEDEDVGVHVPPTGEETRELISYLRTHKVNPVIVGSVGIYHHLQIAAHQFRPTVDLDVFSHAKLPSPPPGWTRVKDSIGVESWESPSGGYVDFLMKGHTFPGGSKNPSRIDIDPKSPEGYPVARVADLLKLKLNSMRDKDLTDAVSLVRAVGMPDIAEFGKLNPLQKENLTMVQQWVDSLKSRDTARNPA